MIKVKRAYDPPSSADGRRILVDRIWPRGLSKGELELDSWERELAPSTELRKWFGHDPERWSEFKKRYSKELEVKHDALTELALKSKHETITLVFGAKDVDHNNAVALKEVLSGL